MITEEDIEAFGEVDKNVTPLQAEKMVLDAYRDMLYEAHPENMLAFFKIVSFYGTLLTPNQITNIMNRAYKEYRHEQN